MKKYKVTYRENNVNKVYYVWAVSETAAGNALVVDAPRSEYILSVERVRYVITGY